MYRDDLDTKVNSLISKVEEMNREIQEIKAGRDRAKSKAAGNSNSKIGTMIRWNDTVFKCMSFEYGIAECPQCGKSRNKTLFESRAVDVECFGVGKCIRCEPELKIASVFLRKCRHCHFQWLSATKEEE